MSKVPLPQNQNNPQIITQTPGQPPQQQIQQQMQRTQQQQQNPFQTTAMKIIEQLILQANKLKEELKQKKSSNPEQRLKDAIKKQLTNQERYLRNSNTQLDDQKKLHKMNTNELLSCIQTMTKIHLDKKNEIEQNINKNIELLKFLQNYKINNPLQNFQERENSQQLASNNYNPNDDSFEQIIQEADKEIKSQNLQYQPQQQYPDMDQGGQDYYQGQGNEAYNNEIQDGAIQNMEYAEENMEEYQYI
ncbi:hypothetical protein ABPG74_006205 [Tetrahymena malaccensis]